MAGSQDSIEIDGETFRAGDVINAEWTNNQGHNLGAEEWTIEEIEEPLLRGMPTMLRCAEGRHGIPTGDHLKSIEKVE